MTRADTTSRMTVVDALEGRQVTDRIDEPTALPDGPDTLVVDIGWTADDGGHAGTYAAAAAGAVTVDEAIGDVAASLGIEERSLLDDEDDYDR